MTTAEQKHQRALTLFRLRSILQRRVRNDLDRIAKLTEQLMALESPKEKPGAG